MRHGNPAGLAVVVASLIVAVGCAAAAGIGADAPPAGQPSAAPPATKPSAAAPLMGILDRFTAAGAPAPASTETAVPALKWDKPIPAGLSGNGLAEHPMLYIGEGYNKIFLVNNGNTIICSRGNNGQGPQLVE